MNSSEASSHKLRNLLQSALLIIGMSLLLALSSRLLFGPDTWVWMLGGILILMLMLPGLSPFWLLKMYQARHIPPQQAPQLVGMLDELAQRAGLPRRPELFWVPSRTLNAFAVGNRGESAIAVTEGLLQLLSNRELAGVLAHEVSHIRNRDLYIMTLADLMTRLTHVLSTTALLMLLVLLPFILLGEASISITGLLLLIIMPSISALLQLGLSRVREFDADLDAARLTHDPAGLASALARIDQRSVNLWQRLVLPGYREQQPSILRLHPKTEERIQRLLSLREQQSDFDNPIRMQQNDPWNHPWRHIRIQRPRHRFFSGTWR